jgi:HD-GYP domain-containing protein (c-di-GMP phosphodiesterase class II)
MSEQTIYYGSISILSYVLLVIYLFRWHKHLDAHMTVIFALIPAINLSYWLMYSSADPEAVMTCLKLSYLGGCFLPWVLTMCVAGLCNFRVSGLTRIATFLVSTVFYLLVLTMGNSELFYKGLSVSKSGGRIILSKIYGPTHTAYYVSLFLYLFADLALILRSYNRQRQVSRRMLVLLYVPIPISILGYSLNRITAQFGFEAVPLTYLIGQAVYLSIAHRMAVYNKSDMLVESMVDSSETGFVTVDFKDRYLGSNETARAILPALTTIPVDGSINKSEELQSTIGEWIDDFLLNRETARHFTYRKPARREADEKLYAVTVDYLTDGIRNYGFQILLRDDTKNQKYIQLLGTFNTDLQKEVENKTQRIVDMHDSLIMGMATMVESRDNSTGGHIRRTSEGVRLLLKEMKIYDSMNLSDSFCKNLIKAAPMHDLGKIAVDDAILRKAGPLTPEEREKMKRHSAEGARIVHEILKETDDEEFRRIAENVAHYHHERVDGKGYPDGLKGSEIPLEARIMAIADSYDALVSKRGYKEAYSFEKANRIILEGMGTQFDEELQWYYEKARPKLEAYYAAEGEEHYKTDTPNS